MCRKQKLEATGQKLLFSYTFLQSRHSLFLFFQTWPQYHYYSHLLTHKIHATCLSIKLLGATQVGQKKIAMSDHQPKRQTAIFFVVVITARRNWLQFPTCFLLYHCSRFLKFFTTTVNLCWQQPMN